MASAVIPQWGPPPHAAHYQRIDRTPLVERFLICLFKCPEFISAAFSSCQRAVQLRPYISEVLRLGPQPKHIIYGGLLLLNRLKAKHPHTEWKWAIRFFVPALMVAAKFLDDHCPFRQANWAYIAQHVPQRQLNEWERMLCRLLDYDLALEIDGELYHFTLRVKGDFCFDEGELKEWPMPARKGLLRKKAAEPPAPNVGTLSQTTTIPGLAPLSLFPRKRTKSTPAALPRKTKASETTRRQNSQPVYPYPIVPPTAQQYHAPVIPSPCPLFDVRTPCPQIVPTPCPPVIPTAYAAAVPPPYPYVPCHNRDVVPPSRYLPQSAPPPISRGCPPISWSHLASPYFAPF